MTRSYEIINKLDTLLSIQVSKGIVQASSLLAGVAETEFKTRIGWFPIETCQDIVTLYGWRSGCDIDDGGSFRFSDQIFTSIEDSEDAYNTIIREYAKDNIPNRDGINIKECFPFSVFQGECMCLPCGHQSVYNNNKRPVLDQAGEVIFHSFEAMLDSLIELENISDEEGWADRDTVSEIFRKHNPNVY